MAAGITAVRNRKRTNHAKTPTKSGLAVILIPILPLFINIGIQSKWQVILLSWKLRQQVPAGFGCARTPFH